MTLSYCPDVSAADWIVASDRDWPELVTFGPGGFEAYARLRFIPDPPHAGMAEADYDRPDDDLSDARQVGVALEILARHTATPGDCYFGLWEGWASDLHGSPPGIAPAFPPAVLDGPRVRLPERPFYLFRGPLSDYGDYGAADLWPGQPRGEMPPPSLTWPADHAWCVAADVDPHWAGIGATAAAVADLIADRRLDVVPADPARPQPYYS
ncbi:hypothetical protein Ade02nite_34330 [Paractinoplanes deccanensis]|uniref:DUF2716 domain-containing protein n=1 Tax=Paractinoplanes deccanensis TaxID=113561 RepID=A0ABQ3Y466_9ACTN|nr:hypothetical protein [Actinoplanes deccanensis]GID74792.1 hypothetical protein Ade02nite_34330 [Actinoplanes deccanensis]